MRSMSGVFNLTAGQVIVLYGSSGNYYQLVKPGLYFQTRGRGEYQE